MKDSSRLQLRSICRLQFHSFRIIHIFYYCLLFFFNSASISSILGNELLNSLGSKLTPSNSEIPSTKVYEDDDFYAFKDIAPVAPVHVLVIPKKHIANIASLTPDDADVAGKMLYTIQKVAQILGLDTDGYRVVFNTGEKAGQTVHHMHAHILGGKEMAWPGV